MMRLMMRITIGFIACFVVLTSYADSSTSGGLVVSNGGYWFETPEIVPDTQKIELKATFTNHYPAPYLSFSPEPYQLWGIQKQDGQVVDIPPENINIITIPASTVARGDTFDYEIEIDISDIPDLKTLAFRIVSGAYGTMHTDYVPVNNSEVIFAIRPPTTATITFGAKVVEVFSNERAFAALKSDGSVVTWGRGAYGGDSSAVSSDLASGVVEVFASEGAFAALKADGSVVSWGHSSWGGDSSAVSSALASGVVKVFSASRAFAAVKADGSVVTWGVYGGDSSAVSSDLASGVVEVFSNELAFAALKADGSVVTWGWSDSGGDSSVVSSDLASGVVEVFSTGYAFAALKADGSVVTWGNSAWGGGGR